MSNPNDSNFLPNEGNPATTPQIPSSRFVSLRVVYLLLTLFFLPQDAYLQSNDVFEVKKQINDVTKRFKLNALDVRSIRPLIIQENKNVIQIYARFSGDEPEYSNRLWQEIVERRWDFESGVRVDLTKRQKAALRAARTGMEKRIVHYLVEDYVSFLAQFLDLSGWEYDYVEGLFESENKKKYRLITDNLSKPDFLQTELEKISEETERGMRKILSGEQWVDYKSLGESKGLIALFRR